jgi:2-dehydro-3-deoxy-D-arabinonate dehydratase
MKIFNTRKGIAIEAKNNLYLAGSSDWNQFINDDNLYQKLLDIVGSQEPAVVPFDFDEQLIAPIGTQEVWACGVTYMRSKLGRQEESKNAGGGDFYDKVYYAERPEVFFKSTAGRIVGPNKPVRIRKDSTWDVPEPELTLVVTSSGKIVGYTVGNDMSSRSIEGENPLYLPQAKTYDGCGSVGPCIFVSETKLDAETEISLTIVRQKEIAFEGKTSVSQMKRTPEELVSFVFRECSFPNGCYIMTGTGIVPGNDFTLQSGDKIHILINGIGELINTVE